MGEAEYAELEDAHGHEVLDHLLVVLELRQGSLFVIVDLAEGLLENELGAIGAYAARVAVGVHYVLEINGVDQDAVLNKYLEEALGDAQANDCTESL